MQFPDNWRYEMVDSQRNVWSWEYWKNGDICLQSFHSYFWPELAMGDVPNDIDITEVTLAVDDTYLVSSEVLLLYVFTFMYDKQLVTLSHENCLGVYIFIFYQNLHQLEQYR